MLLMPDKRKEEGKTFLHCQGVCWKKEWFYFPRKEGVKGESWCWCQDSVWTRIPANVRLELLLHCLANAPNISYLQREPNHVRWALIKLLCGFWNMSASWDFSSTSWCLSHRIREWSGLEVKIKFILYKALPRAGISSTGPGCSEPHSTWP